METQHSNQNSGPLSSPSGKSPSGNFSTHEWHPKLKVTPIIPLEYLKIYYQKSNNDVDMICTLCPTTFSKAAVKLDRKNKILRVHTSSMHKSHLNDWLEENALPKFSVEDFLDYERPYFCRVCESRFKLCHHLKHHMRALHGEELGPKKKGEPWRSTTTTSTPKAKIMTTMSPEVKVKASDFLKPNFSFDFEDQKVINEVEFSPILASKILISTKNEEETGKDPVKIQVPADAGYVENSLLKDFLSNYGKNKHQNQKSTPTTQTNNSKCKICQDTAITAKHPLCQACYTFYNLAERRNKYYVPCLTPNACVIHMGNRRKSCRYCRLFRIQKYLAEYRGSEEYLKDNRGRFLGGEK